MQITQQSAVEQPFVQPTGEMVYPLYYAPRHSIAHIVIPPGASSRNHYHPVAEETYYILNGCGRLVIDDQTTFVQPGDSILIEPNEQHQIFCEGDATLEFLAICAPPWEPTNSVYLDED